MEDMSTKILTVVICILLLAVGIFIITIFVGTTGIDTSKVETFSVADPSVDLTVTLGFNPSQKPTVEQFNGISWNAVSTADVEWSGSKTLVIEHEGMQG